jgi:2-oxoisovalerate dehydrogenase E1 component beta subunit
VLNGDEATVVSWGAPLRVIKDLCVEHFADKIDLIDLRTLSPWDVELVVKSVQKTGRLLIVHEAPKICGLSAEIAATIQDCCLYDLKAPILRECGWDTPYPLAHDNLYLPNKLRCKTAISRLLDL